MKLTQKYFLFCSIISLLMGCAHASDSAPKEYLCWLDNLKEEMISKGISEDTINNIYGNNNFYKPNHEVVKIDRKQTEFVLTSTQYLNRIVNLKRVAQAREKYKQNYELLKPISDKYGVPVHYLVSFWGVETNFGASFGGYSTIEVLTTLSYDKRRSNFFKNELYNALKIIDNNHIDYKKMQGSWAGAMGHFQFMPSTFNAYAVDYNKDGMIDIWNTFPDAAASAANYLSSIGWKKDEPWGVEVTLPWNFNYANSGRNNLKTVKEWKKLGVKAKQGNKIAVKDDVKAAVLLPDGRMGRAYLVFSNFNKIMQWNRSENYALAVGILADYIKGKHNWQALKNHSSQRLKTDDIITIQSFINRIGEFKLEEDGQLGRKTKEAVRAVQKQAHLPQDGYPDTKLLNKIKNYNPEIGFAIPVPDRKLHKVN